MLDLDAPAESPARSPGRTVIAPSELDEALAAQLVVAWAGEQRRLGWWRADMADEYAGHDLLARLAPRTVEWAVLEAARLAARRVDAKGRREAANADDVVSLFRLGFERDERLDERLRELKMAGAPPSDALPSLAASPVGAGILEELDRDAFSEWVASHGSANTDATPVGRRIVGERPDSLGGMVRKLVAGLAPLGDTYPLPHWRGGA